MSWLKHNLFEVLDVLKFVGIFLLVLMFIHFNSAIAKQTQETQDIAANTNRVVKSQDDILQAIKRATEDGKLTSEQKLNVTICMLKVPVSQRTTDVEHNCRTQATLPFPTEPPAKTSTPVTTTSPSQNSVNSAGQGSDSKSEQTQPSTIQKVINKVKDIL